MCSGRHVDWCDKRKRCGNLRGTYHVTTAHRFLVHEYFHCKKRPFHLKPIESDNVLIYMLHMGAVVSKNIDNYYQRLYDIIVN